MRMTAGALLRQYRERRSMSKYVLARRTSISHSNLFKLEAGTRQLNANHLTTIIPALDLAVDEIEEIIRVVAAERTADLDALLDREYVRLIPHGIRKGVTA